MLRIRVIGNNLTMSFENTVGIVDYAFQKCLNLLFIPAFGAEGTAVASLIAQILTGFVFPFFIKELRETAFLMLEAIMLKGVFTKDKG